LLLYIYPRISYPAYTAPFAPVALAIPPYWAGCYTDRRSRFEYRACRRAGDYFAYGAPAYMLWTVDPFASAYPDPYADSDNGI
jgi:hypothetical protein